MAVLSPAARGQCVTNELTTLTATDAAINDYAGKSVSISGDVAVVSANKDDAAFESGAAYIFRSVAGKWEQEAKLTASDERPGDAILVTIRKRWTNAFSIASSRSRRRSPPRTQSRRSLYFGGGNSNRTLLQNGSSNVTAYSAPSRPGHRPSGFWSFSPTTTT